MKKCVIVLVLVLALMLQGCSSGEKNSQETKTNGKKDTAVTVKPTSNSDFVLPVTKNDTGKVLIQTVSASMTYTNNSYIITSTNGESIVVDPTEMPDKSIVDINPVAILSTHSHPDHTDATFTDSYDVPKLLYKEGEIKTKDFNIYSVPSSHMGQKIVNNNFIMVIEVDGLRIAHMGDIGQPKLTDDQLKKIGKIDIAFMQYENMYSNMDTKNMKGFNLMEQLQPKIIITTHTGSGSEAMLKQKCGLKKIDNLMEISKDDLPDTTLNAYKILNKHKYRS